MSAPPVSDDFVRLADPYRRELLAHCYRMLGSVQDAEDLVQETYLRAWRGYPRFEGRSSLRTWLYRIATTACLTALESRRRRPLPTGLGAPSHDPGEPLTELPEIGWLEPIPDALVDDSDDPAAIVAARESTRLAFIAALQHLPPRQRAALLLRDVLRWKASEVAAAMGTSIAAANSALQRARAQLQQIAPQRDGTAEPSSPELRRLLDRYVTAFEDKDIPAIVELFTEDAVWEMPPYANWIRGAEAIGELVDRWCPADRGELRLVPTSANGQPAFGMYRRDPAGGYVPFQLHVLAPQDGRIGHVVAFFDVALFPRFGLPDALPAERGADR
ncbi:sigma-70 family RNA polymerase sigma factor [Saccharopolyspora sp. CA-218241]|uniref:sigma-70 family RNA polymerase sigma factor n=1 Tax=Saccharopolyspora sp. CA-218241 TaxID=3240027 RepID=UPI003D9902A1